MGTNVQEGKMPEFSMNRGNLLDRSINTRQDNSTKATESDAASPPKLLVRRQGDKRAFTCGLCSATFNHSSTLKTHIHTHTGEKAHKCSHCESSFTQLSGLQRHLRTHTGEKPYQCTTCKAEFSESSNLKRHVRTHTGEKPFKCTLCPAAFSHSSHLTEHKRNHTGEKPYRCTFCQAAFSESSNLKRHVRTHTGEKPFKCTLCQASFSHSSHLTQHKRNHTGERPYECTCCRASFSYSSGLKRHIRTHTGEKPYECTVCERSFINSGHLTEHMRTHTGERPFKCTVCEASFSHSRSLNYHIKTHTGETPFQCTVCRASFKQLGYLNRHMKTHGNEKPHVRTNISEKSSFSQEGSSECCMKTQSSGKPFKCDHCTLSFHQSSELKSHVKTHAVLGNSHGHETADKLNSHENKSIGASDMPSHHVWDISRACTISYSQEKVKEEPNVTESSKGLSVSEEGKEIKIEEHDLDLEMTATVEQGMCDGYNVTPYLKIYRNPGASPHLPFEFKYLPRSASWHSNPGVQGVGCIKGYVPQELQCIVRIFQSLSWMVQEGRMPDTSMNRENLLNKNINTRQENSMKDIGPDAARSHKSPVITADTNGFKCGLSSATFTHSSELKAHINTGERPHKCSHCESSFTWPGDLQRHLRTHTGEKPYECTICKAVFSESGNLNVHVRTHTGEKPYECTTCKTVFSHLSNLKRHVRTHTGEKPYVCTVCQGSFLNPSHLTEHMRTHTGEKPFQCTVCEASFSHSRSLKFHIRTHTGEKPFQCTVCRASFTRSGNLKRHMMTHTNEKPHMRANTDEKCYASTVHQSSFSQGGSTKCCMRTHSSGKPFKCDHCTLSFHQASELKSHVKTHVVLSNVHGHEAADKFVSHENKSIGTSDMSSHHVWDMSRASTVLYSQEEVKKEPNVTQSSCGLSVSEENMEIKIEEHDLDLEMIATVEQDLFDG
ncbi:uncharacterized protein LOC143030300 [Oratosquilla oratoria]|uniref:uncharacterized protein LOC143030300 n=1 Tax=Oratosquilla oratoria TaxID=337810 RepID=UPI003F7667BB